MKEQNIYDNREFFDGYKKIRENPMSANNVVEKPAIFGLCPDFNGKTVLDVGCGFGENCVRFVELGAIRVVGLDISEKMLEVAKSENSLPEIEYINKSASDLHEIKNKFDVVISSLAVHYIEDLKKLAKDVFNLLNDGGYFIFSQEHPLTTALLSDDYWTKTEDGEIIKYNLTTYSLEGERRINWLNNEVIKYHRSFSGIINSLVETGFTIEKMLEPVPSEDIMEQYPAYKRYIHKPDFLMIRAKK